MVNYRRLGSVRKEFLLLGFTVYQKTASSLSSICTGQYPLRQRNSVTSPHVFRYTNHLFKEAGLIQTLSSTPDYSHLVFLVFAKGKTVWMQRSSQHVTKTDWFLREREKSIFLVNRVTFKHWIGVLSFFVGTSYRAEYFSSSYMTWTLFPVSGRADNFPDINPCDSRVCW